MNKLFPSKSHEIHEEINDEWGTGGRAEIWTRGLYHAKVAIFQLIYTP